MSLPNSRIILYHVFTRLFGNTNTTNKEWGTIEENGVGKFNDFNEKALEAIANMGFTHIWYTGVIEHGLLTDYSQFGIDQDHYAVVKGRAGSPYAIKDYYDVNPDLADKVPDRMKEFENLVKRTHAAGMKAIIDFVPNHVARAYKSDAKPKETTDLGASDDWSKAFDPNNNYYYIPDQDFVMPEVSHYPDDVKTHKPYLEHPARATGNDVFSSSPSINDWFETVKLNYGVDYENGHQQHFEPIPDTWLKMRDILLYWAGKNIDGFRCDMAEMVPVEFWHWVTKEVKGQFPNIIFIAEVYNPDQYRNYIFHGGFDYLYDKVELYDTLKGIIQKHINTDWLTNVWQKQDGIVPNMLRFLENHDEQRIASPFFAGDAHKGIPMMAATAFMHTGPVMMYFGQEVGEPAAGACGFSGNDGRTTIFDYWGVPEHAKWMNNGKFDGGGLSEAQKQLRSEYVKILKACNELEALRKGAFYDLHYYNRNHEYTGYSDQVYAFVRHSNNQVILVLINFSENEQTARIKAPKAAWDSFGILSEKAIAGDSTFELKSTLAYDSESELLFTISPLCYQLVQINPI